MMYKDKGNLSINKERSRVESLAADILAGDFQRIGPFTADASHLLVQFCAEGHLATRERYDEDERKRQCDWAVESANEAVFVDIVPEIFCATVYGQDEEWSPTQNAEDAMLKGLPYDILVIYLEGLPLAVSVFASEEYNSEVDDSTEEVEISSSPVYIDAIQAMYVDKGVVSELGLSDEDVGIYLEMLISRTLKRFNSDSDTAEMFRPTITIVKNQEGYFSQMAEDYYWGKTEDEPGYLVFN